MTFPPLPPLVWPKPLRSMTPIWALVVICCAVELCLMLAGLGWLGPSISRNQAIQNGAFWGGLLDNWQPNYRSQPWLMFWTYIFLHTGPMHLLGNMLGLIWLGPTLLQRLGLGGLLTLWLLSAAGGALCFALLSTAPAPMVGASGLVFGLMGGYVTLDYLDRHDLRAALAMTAGLAALNGVTMVLERGVLAWETHLGGYVIGAAVVALINPGAANRG